MSNMRNLYLITDGFPFGKGEKPFILPELPYLMEEYKVTVISPAPREIAEDVNYITKLDDRIKLIHIPPLVTATKSTRYKQYHKTSSSSRRISTHCRRRSSSTRKNERCLLQFCHGRTVLSTGKTK